MLVYLSCVGRSVVASVAHCVVHICRFRPTRLLDSRRELCIVTWLCSVLVSCCCVFYSAETYLLRRLRRQSCTSIGSGARSSAEPSHQLMSVAQLAVSFKCPPLAARGPSAWLIGATSAPTSWRRSSTVWWVDLTRSLQAGMCSQVVDMLRREDCHREM